jgi:hypothetical protein
MTAPRQVEYLYAHDTHMCGFDGADCPCFHLTGRAKWDHHVIKLRITKKTAKRVYYLRPDAWADSRIGFVDRQQLEADGKVWRRSSGWWEPDAEVYAEHPDPPSGFYLGEQQPDLSELRAEMADAHPDRGGTSAAFIEAHDRYLAAKGRSA